MQPKILTAEIVQQTTPLFHCWFAYDGCSKLFEASEEDQISDRGISILIL